MVIGNFGGKLTPVTVMFRVTNIEENTKQKHPQTHEESHYSLHTETHPVPWNKPTLLTITQLLPGTTVISHIALLINYLLSRGPLYSWPPRILNQFGLYTKTREKAPTFSSTNFFS